MQNSSLLTGPKYDLEERTYRFAKNVRELIKKTPRTIGNIEDAKQLIRSSGSIGANYIEANESLGDKDFVWHAKISKKEAKETIYWLRLIDIGSDPMTKEECSKLITEAKELMLIFGGILRSFKSK